MAPNVNNTGPHERKYSHGHNEERNTAVNVVQVRLLSPQLPEHEQDRPADEEGDGPAQQGFGASAMREQADGAVLMAVKHQEWTQNDRANKGLRGHGGEPVECEHRDGPVYFNRSPRVEGRYAGQEFAAPEVPTEKDDQPFPWPARVAPVLLGVSM
ncbi:hypothetical protein E3T46_10535 [Cryobacterium sp. Hh11]|uniref:hypothetical protein n=1 Tax=Cryobacterium sp. Hh11 TaxID=2555868 RepID=UPI001069B1BD|nr:hypothetical protein [Cryobacterium sp. Hh11]TFD50752.1 hypothetical protein E3T46_10535 [Cryobacterium sp. Hh11]